MYNNIALKGKAQVIGERGKKFMKKTTTKYTNEPIGKVKVVEDFLPSSEELVLKKEDTTKITLLVNTSSLEYFKGEAQKYNSHYQTMIRNLLEQYTSRCSNKFGHRVHGN